MKVQPVITRTQTEASNNDQRKKNPSFGSLSAPLVSFATFIENNGFLGEFLTIDTFGMMGPRTIQGYTRNKEELGHLNYKAGREELVRELLSGPAYFFVPLGIITLAAALRGKCAKVNNAVMERFKPLMEKFSGDIKNTAAVKENFVNKFSEEAFQGYTKETDHIEKITNLLKKVTKNEMTAKKAGKEAEVALTALNKANGKYLDNTSHIKLGDKSYNITSLFSDVSNYLDHFTKKASKTTDVKETFIDKFHKNAKDLRNAANILAITALSAFLLIIPKLYQTDKKFPGKDGLVDNDPKTPANSTGAQPVKTQKEVANDNK